MSWASFLFWCTLGLLCQLGSAPSADDEVYGKAMECRVCQEADEEGEGRREGLLDGCWHDVCCWSMSVREVQKHRTSQVSYGTALSSEEYCWYRQRGM